MPPAQTIAPLHIRKSLTMAVVFGAIFVAGALFFAWAIGGRLWSGRTVDGMSWLWLLGMAGMAGWTLRDAVDRRVQVTLTAEGFSDRRTGGAITPWSAVRGAVGFIANGVEGVEFAIGPDDARHLVRIVLRNLDASSADILAYVRRAAPHVEIPKAFDLLKGWVDG